MAGRKPSICSGKADKGEGLYVSMCGFISSCNVHLYITKYMCVLDYHNSHWLDSSNPTQSDKE